MVAEETTAPTYLPVGLPAPAPERDGVDAPFWEGLRRHALMIQRCARCAGYQHPAEWICHHCRSWDLEWTEAAGAGVIYSWERVWHPTHPALKDACPYLAVLVELPGAGGVRLIGNLLGDPLQDVAIGATVEAVFEDHPEGHTLLQWRAVTSP